jgi:hypothetical protein
MLLGWLPMGVHLFLLVSVSVMEGRSLVASELLLPNCHGLKTTCEQNSLELECKQWKQPGAKLLCRLLAQIALSLWGIFLALPGTSSWSAGSVLGR